jgi:molybdate transport repressor ModE-like protein/molybdopterin-binding protein
VGPSVLNHYKAVVASFDRRDSHAWLVFGKARLAARLWPGIKAKDWVTVEIRPEDVVLCTSHPGRTSARNVLPGLVRTLKRAPEGVQVTLDVGFPLTALVTGGAVVDLGLRRGSKLVALVKATAIVPVRSVRAKVLAALVGSRGVIPSERVELLRAIDRTGSMSGAARALGISYRTAWMWVQAINRAWGSPLVDRVRGGLGAGTTLTPEGRGALKLASSAESRPARRSTSI